MYWRKVRLFHLPSLLMVVSSQPWILSAMAPPAWSDWEPTRSGSMPCWCSFKCLVAMRTTAIIPAGFTCYHMSLHLYAQRSVSVVPPSCRMACTTWARALTGHMSMPVASWWIVSPIRLFFWWEMFRVAESLVRSTFTGDDRETMCPSLKNPTSPTENCCVRVALTRFPSLMKY